MIRNSVLTALCGIALTACAPEGASQPPEALLALAPQGQRTALAAAQRHVVVVRHARREPGCGALDCPLTEEGDAEVVRLGELFAGTRIDARYASAACRTAATAMAGGGRPRVYRAIDPVDGGCPDLNLSPGEYTRAEAQVAVRESDEPWTLVADHSNFVCVWAATFGVRQPSACVNVALAETNYGDIFWLHQGAPGEPWRLTYLVDAFAGDVAPDE